ncbi:hypothetical [Parasynechococcus marenigrum WH 8102]|uniref:Uncharacterized protein n=1 Tax=Parasynechococcus marenigrum (strain WH8102) TaxID=84588 RepID=Q7U6H3_PARMW|nr:hypothetical [Parasynechococcus marenigrum WH 8102]
MHVHRLTKVRRRRSVDQTTRFAAGDDVLERHGHDSKLAYLNQSPSGLPHCSGIGPKPGMGTPFPTSVGTAPEAMRLNTDCRMCSTRPTLWSSRSEVPMTADTPPEQHPEAA